MDTILEKLAAHARERVAADKQNILPADMRQRALAQRRDFRFSGSLAGRKERGETALICEVKKASPSKGIIDPEFDYNSIAADYEEAGADCISCLTEPRWFLGSDEIFADIRGRVSLPMIRKDFVVDSYQIYQACCLGADAVLLICAITDEKKLSQYLEECGSLGLDALVEAHDEAEIKTALRAGARMIGVNNRNLRDFSVDFDNARNLRDKIPDSVIFVAESGVRSSGDVAMLHDCGADAVLAGEVLMRASDRKALLREMKQAAGQGPF